MGALFERPAFLIVFLLLAAAVVIVLVIVVAARSSKTATPPPVQPTGLPGWYPQPDGTQRYWDGREWTEHTA